MIQLTVRCRVQKYKLSNNQSVMTDLKFSGKISFKKPYFSPRASSSVVSKCIAFQGRRVGLKTDIFKVTN